MKYLPCTGHTTLLRRSIVPANGGTVDKITGIFPFDKDLTVIEEKFLENLLVNCYILYYDDLVYENKDRYSAV